MKQHWWGPCCSSALTIVSWSFALFGKIPWFASQADFSKGNTFPHLADRLSASCSHLVKLSEECCRVEYLLGLHLSCALPVLIPFSYSEEVSSLPTYHGNYMLVIYRKVSSGEF
jgi:hypothetical protein